MGNLMAHPRTTITTAAATPGVLLVVTDNGRREFRGNPDHAQLADVGLRALDIGDRARVVIPGPSRDLVCVCAKDGASRVALVHLSGEVSCKSSTRVTRNLAKWGAT